MVSGIELSASLTRLNLHQPSLTMTHMLKVTKPVAGSRVRPMILVWTIKMTATERTGAWSAMMLKMVPRVKRHLCHLPSAKSRLDLHDLRPPE